LSIGSCLYVLFLSLVSIFVSCTHQLVVLCRSIMHPRQHLSLQFRATANEGARSATAAWLAVASSVTVVSAGLWLRLPPWKCTAAVVVAMATSPPVSYLGSLHPLLHTMVPRKLSRGDYVLNLCYVWLVLVQFYSM
jgi:hypothetical protein